MSNKDVRQITQETLQPTCENNRCSAVCVVINICSPLQGERGLQAQVWGVCVVTPGAPATGFPEMLQHSKFMQWQCKCYFFCTQKREMYLNSVQKLACGQQKQPKSVERVHI